LLRKPLIFALPEDARKNKTKRESAAPPDWKRGAAAAAFHDPASPAAISAPRNSFGASNLYEMQYPVREAPSEQNSGAGGACALLCAPLYDR
jgi:hypothetical protein